jgi:hypothetical protein
MKRDCEWNEGKLKCCGRIVCELAGDDVSESFHEVCKENRKSKLWKECSEFKHGSGLVFARIMVNEILDYEKKHQQSLEEHGT